jgi:TonB family protein
MIAGPNGSGKSTLTKQLGAAGVELGRGRKGGNVAGQGNVAIGGVVLAAGVLVTIATFTAAAPGGTWVLAWGAIAAGLVQLLTGLVQMSDEARAEPAAAPATDARLLAGSIGEEDYPDAAVRAGVEGSVTAGFTVTARGVVEDVHVLSSSGSGILDRAACRLIAERFRFEPARDSAGTPIAQKLRRTVTWRLPEE